ncbi:MAG: leucine--tRNA ligase [bacterium]
MIYNPQEIEPKWQEKWEDKKIYQAIDFDKKPKFYVLIEFPYPSGAGLHVGHARSWSAMDTYSRKKRMDDYNVLYPIGWDAFGLPAENYAIKMGLHPSKTVSENINRFKEQCQAIGLSFDWSREINTTDPKYYKWTQWIFLKLLENNLAYQAEVTVNWCPFCKTNLADEEVMPDGNHERCGKMTEKRMQKQWLLRITKYAERLLSDLNLVDYSYKIRVQQENWIGKSEGVIIDYPITNSDKIVSCYSTRPDTNFGATFIVIAPEHQMVNELVTAENKQAVSDYINNAKRKSEIERADVSKEKTGVFTGSYALNRLNNRKMPIWVSDFVVLSAGTGVVVGVPAHDKRDWDFAKKHNIEIIPVVKPDSGNDFDFESGPFTEIDEAIIFNSEFLNGLKAIEAKEKIIGYLADKGWGKRAVNYRIRDWIFSRQHYWGEPIPIIHCEKCGAVPVPINELPIELPYVEKYEPSGTGESPLAKMTDWVNVKCPECGGSAKRETDTMPNWAGSNWYYIRYLDNGNGEALADKKKMEYWMPIDIYEGGFEHTTLHLLYSRFIYKFLFDIGIVPGPEPYKCRRSHGIVLGPDNRKMSKSFGNVVNPDDIIGKRGADSLRLYEMFMGPFEQEISWNDSSLDGCYRFLNRIWKLFNENIKNEPTPDYLSIKLHRVIKKVGEDILAMRFNTMVAAMMEFSNEWEDSFLSKTDAEMFIKILAPSAPHLAEEIWVNILGNKFSVHQESWPVYDQQLILNEVITLVIQINGKVRDRVETSSGVSKNEAVELVNTRETVKKWLTGKEIKRIVFVADKLINIIC